VRGGEGQQQGRPSSQHPDSFHLGQAAGSAGRGGGAGVGGGVERHHVLTVLELQERLRPAHLQVGLGRGGHLVVAGDGERQRLLGGRARPLAQHRLQLQPAELAGVCSGAGHRPHSASAGSLVSGSKRWQKVAAPFPRILQKEGRGFARFVVVCR